jgi:hypothetical protein
MYESTQLCGGKADDIEMSPQNAASHFSEFSPFSLSAIGGMVDP